MEIIQPNPSDLIEIVYLQKVCFAEMKSKGFLSFELFKELSLEDLSKIFILKLSNLTVGLFILNEAQSEEIQKNNKNGSSKPLIIDELIIHPNWWDKNIADKLLHFAEEYGRKNGFTSIKLNAFAENENEISLFKQFNFQQTEEFHPSFQKVPFYYYEKKL